jgi:hypothetical protein
MDHKEHTSRRSFFAVLYFKTGLVIMNLLLIIFMSFILISYNYEAETTTYIVITSPIRRPGTIFNVKTDNYTPMVILGAIFLGWICGSCIILFKKGVFTFDDTYIPMSDASKHRKHVFLFSILLGGFGVDRFATKRIFTGIFKLLLFIISGVCFVIILLEPDIIFQDVFFLSIPIYLFIYWWIGDIIYITLGAAKEKGGSFIR